MFPTETFTESWFKSLIVIITIEPKKKKKKNIGSKVKYGIEAEEEGDTPMGFTTQINK